MLNSLIKIIPESRRPTFFLRIFGFFKIPLLYFLKPKVLEVNDQRCVILIPLSRRSKNHLNSMYFGALAAGADCAAGFIGFEIARRVGEPVLLVFKDFKAEFLKRAEGDVVFTCDDGQKVKEAVEETIRTGERVECLTNVVATVPKKLGDEPVARFQLTLSLKKRRKK